jgi:hypothetical protein
MKLLNFQQDVVLGTPTTLDVERLVRETLVVERVACSWSRHVAMAYVGLLHRGENDSETRDTLLEHDLTGGVIDVSELHILQGLTVEPGVLRLSGFMAGYTPPGYHEGYTTRFTCVLACREARLSPELASRPKPKLGGEVGLTFRADKRSRAGDVAEVSLVSSTRFRPTLLTADHGLPWSIEGVQVGPVVVHDKGQKELFFQRGERYPFSLACLGWPDVEAGAMIRLKVRAQVPDQPPFECALRGVELL